MTADVELLPCPCGASAKIYPTGTEIGPREKLVASCDDPECHWSMIGFGPEQVAERWNRRANTEALRAEVDRLNELCNGLHRSLTDSQAAYVSYRERAQRAEALRAEVEAARGRAAENLQRAFDAEARAERLAEALQIAFRHLDIGSLQVGHRKDLAAIVAALHPTAAQENDDA